MGEEEFARVVEGRFRKRVDEVEAPFPNKPSMISLLIHNNTTPSQPCCTSAAYLPFDLRKNSQHADEENLGSKVFI